ncbi:hypothetical protein Bca101_077253 [Brassica carinata]
MNSQLNLVCFGGTSAMAKRRLELDLEEEIIRIPECDLTEISEQGRARGTNLGNGRFQFDFDKEEDLNMVTGVPVHFWNDKTFEEISKALGKKMTLDAKNARLQVSIDAEKPLQFNRRIGFPNGDIGRISEEERERFVKELREQNAVASQNHQQLAPPPNSRNNKRPRSPSVEAPKRSPTRYQCPGSSRGEKRSKESEYYWTAKRNEERSPREKDLRKGYHQDPVEKSFRRDSRNTSIWNRLEENESCGQRGTSRTGLNSSSQRNHRRPGNNRATNSRENMGNARSYNCSSPLSQQVWRPRSPTKETIKDPLRMSEKDGQRDSPRSKADSQQTILEIPTTRYPPTTHENEPRSGVLIVHQNQILRTSYTQACS